MDIQKIKELVDFITKLDIKKVHIKTQDISLSIKKPVKHHSTSYYNPTVSGIPPTSTKNTENKPVVTDNNKEKEYITIKSPMIGTFYLKSNPEASPFVKKGDQVKKNQVLCIIEAMKIFNEIESHVEGKIVKILVQDASPVEFDQPIFLVEPN